MTDDISVARAMEPLFAEEGSLFPAPNANGDMKEPRFLSEGAFDTVTSYVRRLAERGAKRTHRGAALERGVRELRFRFRMRVEREERTRVERRGEDRCR